MITGLLVVSSCPTDQHSYSHNYVVRRIHSCRLIFNYKDTMRSSYAPRLHGCAFPASLQYFPAILHGLSSFNVAGRINTTELLYREIEISKRRKQSPPKMNIDGVALVAGAGKANQFPRDALANYSSQVCDVIWFEHSGASHLAPAWEKLPCLLKRRRQDSAQGFAQ